MKTKDYIVTIFIILMLLTGCTREKTTYYKNGVKSSEISYYRGKPVGEATFWHPDGKLMQKTQYENGKVEGTLQRWYGNGNIELEEKYINDLRNGKSTTYNVDGAKMIEIHYTRDTMNGEYIEYYLNGIKKIHGFYKMGLFEGKWTWFDHDGVVLGRAEFIDGNGIQQAWRRDGSLLSEIEYKRNMKQGFERHYDQKGKLLETTHNQ